MSKTTIKKPKPIQKGIIEGFIRGYKEFFNPSKYFHVWIFQANGEPVELLVKEDKNKFIYKGRTYYIKDNAKFYNPRIKEWCLLYNYQVSVPIEFSFENLNTQNPKVIQSVDSATLTQLIKSTVIEKLLGSDELIEGLNFLKMIAVINGILTLGIILGILRLSGVF